MLPLPAIESGSPPPRSEITSENVAFLKFSVRAAKLGSRNSASAADQTSQMNEVMCAPSTLDPVKLLVAGAPLVHGLAARVSRLLIAQASLAKR